MDSKISPREQWTSKLGFILAAAGSAVGLGNLWGFAYRASQGGGAAFVLLYLLIVLIVCLPVFVAEMALGRNATASTLLAPVKLAGKNWYPLGILFFIAPLGIASYYSVIMGWTADTLFHSLFFGLPKNLSDAETFFGSISSGSSVLLGASIKSCSYSHNSFIRDKKRNRKGDTILYAYPFYNSSIASNMGHFTFRRMGRIQNIFV